MEVKSNVKEACRLCLRGEGKISVFENDVKVGNITAESVYKCVSVKITEDDKLPTGICESCSQSVANWCTFKTTCDQTQEILQGWLSEDILEQKDDYNVFEDDIESSSGEVFKIPDEQICTTKPDLPSEPVASPSSSSTNTEKGEQDTNFRPEENKLVDDECLPSSNVIPDQENLPAKHDNVESQSELLEKSGIDTVSQMDVSELDDRSSQDNEYVNMCDSVVNIRKSSTSKNNDGLNNEVDCKYDSIDSIHNNDEVLSLPNKNLVGESETKVENFGSDEKKSSERVEICLDVEDSSSVELLTEVQEKSKVEIKAPLDTVLDSDVENSMPSSCISVNSTKTDVSKERMDDASSLCEDFNSVPFTAAVTIDVCPFNNKNDHDGQESLQSVPDKSLADTSESESTQLPPEKEKEMEMEVDGQLPQVREVESVTPLSQDNAEPDVVSSSVSPPVEKIDEKEGEVSSSVEKQHPSPPQVEREEAFDKSAEISSEQRPELEDNNSLPLVVQIKEEPIDSTTDDNLSQNFVRVKSEFSTFNFESDHVEDQSWEMGGGIWQPSGSADDPNNTECFVCKRKYSSVSNFKAHLQTKMHLFNSGQSVESAPTPKDPPKEMTSTFESPLLRSRLSTGPLNQSFIDSPPPATLSSSPVPKRKYVDHCGLCNVSFSFTSELRRHLFSKKHRFNTRIARMKGDHPELNPMKIMPSQPAMQYSREPAPDVKQSQGSSKSIFICPIQNCNFSCATGESLLYHMQVHGIAQPSERMPEPTQPKQKLSLRQQDLLRKEAEMKREAELKKKRDAELQMIRETELRIKREAELKMKREAEMRMKREAEMKMKREMEMKMMREAEMRQMKERQELLRQQMQGGPMAHFQCQGCQKLFVRESGLKKHSWYCRALRNNLKQELIEEVDEEDLIEEVEEEDEDDPMIDLNEDSGGSESHCPLCDISFTARNVFINHIQIYHKGSYLESSIPKSTPNIKKIPPKHTMRPVGKTPLLQTASKMRVTNKTHGFGCDICGKKFNLLSSLNFHLKTHTVSVRHVCRICKEPFTNRKAFMEHCRQHFLKRGSKETLCHKCFKVFKTRSELYHHRKNDQCAIKMKIYTCNYCQHSFKDPEALEEHKERFHNSDSIDPPQDEMQGSTYTEMYDDSIIPLNPLCLLSEPNENLPGTSKPSSGYSLNYNKAAMNTMKFGNANPSNYEMKNSPTYNPSSSGTPGIILQCNICKTPFSSKASLKKHTLMFHILNKPYYGSRRYGSLKRGGILQGNLKQWKCKHCKQAFLTRKVLVHHLKKCEHNSFEDMKGICLQCGKWCESGKTRICRFCLPDLPPDDPSLNDNQIRNMNQMRMAEQMTSLNSQPLKNIKQEFDGSSSPFQGGSMNQDYQEHQSNKSFPMVNPQTQIKPENIKKEIPGGEFMEMNPKMSKQSNAVNIDEINLMKCPVGNKYFRNEMIMVKHYSECDGSCENRCSHCRKLFHTPKEYKIHLLYSKCFKRNDTKKKSKLRYPTFACKKKKVRREPMLSYDTKTQLHEIDLKASIFKQTSDEFSDNTMDTTACSEDSSNIGGESSSTLANKLVEEKSLKLGRICHFCNKVITMQRAVYRHAYGCCKTYLHTQDSVTCPKCSRTFTKQVTMKDNASGLRQHVLDCHFVPYYIGQGSAEDGSLLDIPPQYLCYVCSFGFSSNESLMSHIKDHRNKKDEVNNIVLQLEDELLSDERLADEKSMLSLHIREITPTNVTPVLAGRVLSLQEQIDHSKQVLSHSVNVYNCETCGRKFYNRKKYLRHRMVHRIITKNVFSEPVKTFVDLEKDNALLNTE